MKDHSLPRHAVKRLGGRPAELVNLENPGAESFRFSREWLRTETTQASALRSSSVLRRLNLPPSYLPVHRVLASGLGVLCQLDCEVPFRAASPSETAEQDGTTSSVRAASQPGTDNIVVRRVEAHHG